MKKFLVDHKFSKIFLYVGSIEDNKDQLLNGILYDAGNTNATVLIQDLVKLGIEVEIAIYVNGKVNDFTNVELVPKVAEALSKVKSKIGFSTLAFDQEPSDPAKYPVLLNMFEQSRKYIPVSTVLKPKWLYDKVADFKFLEIS